MGGSRCSRSALSTLIKRRGPGSLILRGRHGECHRAVRLNEVRGGSQQAIEDQIHVRHILMKTNELADEATVRAKLNSLRDRVLRGEDFAGLREAVTSG